MFKKVFILNVNYVFIKFYTSNPLRIFSSNPIGYSAFRSKGYTKTIVPPTHIPIHNPVCCLWCISRKLRNKNQHICIFWYLRVAGEKVFKCHFQKHLCKFWWQMSLWRQWQWCDNASMRTLVGISSGYFPRLQNPKWRPTRSAKVAVLGGWGEEFAVLLFFKIILEAHRFLMVHV